MKSKFKIAIVIFFSAICSSYAQSSLHNSLDLTDSTASANTVITVNVQNGTLDFNNLTIEAWIYLNSYNNNTGYNSDIFSCKADTNLGNQGFTFSTKAGITNHQYDGELAFGFASGADFNSGNSKAYSHSAIPVDSWHHVAVTWQWNGAILNYYIDGILNSSYTNVTDESTNASPVPFHAMHDYYVGAEDFTTGSTGTPTFNGKIDELRIWNKVRTQQDIQSDMNCELLGTEDSLKLYYKFNETSGGVTVQDATFNLHNGAVVPPITSTPSVNVICTDGIEKLNVSREIIIYPNPASNILIVKNIDPQTPIKVRNLLGETLIQKVSHDNSIILDISFLPAGIYFINELKFIKCD